MMGCVGLINGDDESQPSTSDCKKQKSSEMLLHSIPRKLRSAIKKQGHECISLQHHFCNGIKKLKEKCPKKSIQIMKKGDVSKDEEEVAETLYALAGMFETSKPMSEEEPSKLESWTALDDAKQPELEFSKKSARASMSRVNQPKKRCPTHVCIARLIKALQKPETSTELMQKPTQLTNDGGVNDVLQFTSKCINRAGYSLEALKQFHGPAGPELQLPPHHSKAVGMELQQQKLTPNLRDWQDGLLNYVQAVFPRMHSAFASKYQLQTSLALSNFE